MKNETILKTEKLVLHPWRETDAASLYEYAKEEWLSLRFFQKAGF